MEHDTAKVLLIDLAEAAEDDPYLDAKLTVLREYIKHHVAEEEKPDEGIFARAQAAGIDLEDMGRKIQERRSELQAELHSQVDEQGADASEDATTRLRPVSLRVASVRVITGTGQEQSIMGRQYEQERDDRGRFMREDERQRYGGPQGRQFGGRDRGDWDRNGWERDEQGRFAREGDEGRYWDEGRRDEGRGGYQSRWESDQGYDQGYDRGGGQQYREQEYGNRFMGDTGDYRGRDEDYYSSRGEYEDRDERGRFMSRGEDRYGRGGGYYREESSGYGGRGRDEQPRDDQGRFMSERGERGDYRARGRDEGGRERSRSGRDQGRDQGGWFGEPRRHAEAARLGWRHRQ